MTESDRRRKALDAWRMAELRAGQATAAYERGDRAEGEMRLEHYRDATSLRMAADLLEEEAKRLARTLHLADATRRTILGG